MKKTYIITNSCYWHDNKEKRSTHYIEVVDVKTGEIKHLKNGTTVQIIRGEAEDK